MLCPSCCNRGWGPFRRYRIPNGTRQLKIQLWGGGGGSGYLHNQCAGCGGGGAFVEALLNVRSDDVLEVTVGAGGGAGTPGTRSQVRQWRHRAHTRGHSCVVTSATKSGPLGPPRFSTGLTRCPVISMVQVSDPMNPSKTIVQEDLGVAPGGFPGGGPGHSHNLFWAAGGGGGYSMVQRNSVTVGLECVLVAGGGGGGAYVAHARTNSIARPSPASFSPWNLSLPVGWVDVALHRAVLFAGYPPSFVPWWLAHVHRFKASLTVAASSFLTLCELIPFTCTLSLSLSRCFSIHRSFCPSIFFSLLTFWRV